MAVTVAVAGALAGCSSTPTKELMPDGQCVALADSLKTLRPGDELPRVVEVLGKPTETYHLQGSYLFSKPYDVLVYDTTGSACGRILLNSPQALHLLFNSEGRLIAQSGEKFKNISRGTLSRSGRLGGM
jgi:outer membrane protein assembly factor BamE (lipoprotein component of BamABCDE complex)